MVLQLRQLEQLLSQLEQLLKATHTPVDETEAVATKFMIFGSWDYEGNSANKYVIVILSIILIYVNLSEVCGHLTKTTAAPGTSVDLNNRSYIFFNITGYFHIKPSFPLPVQKINIHNTKG